MNYVDQVVQLAQQRHTIMDIVRISGVEEKDVLRILHNPRAAKEAYANDLLRKREYIDQLRAAKPPSKRRKCDQPCTWRMDGKPYCVGPVCWREVLGPHQEGKAKGGMINGTTDQKV